MSAPRRDLQFWFELASTYSYPAAMCIEAAAAARDVTVQWRPFLLGPIFGAQGWTDSPFNLYAAKGRYMWRDLERLCAANGIAYRKPDIFPQHSVQAARVALQGAEAAWGPAFVRACYTANFAEGRDISDPEVLAPLITRAGGDARAVLAACDAPGTKEHLRAQVGTAVELGIFGAPSFIAGDELFWGFDRMEVALDWAAGKGEAP